MTFMVTVGAVAALPILRGFKTDIDPFGTVMQARGSKKVLGKVVDCLPLKALSQTRG